MDVEPADSCGIDEPVFDEHDDVIALRRREDAAALAVVHASPRWLDFLDSQYAPPPAQADIAYALADVIEEFAPATTAMPLALFHADHRLVGAACQDLIRHGPRTNWVAYEEAIYRHCDAASIPARLCELSQFGTWSAVACGLRTDGTVTCWGYGTSGQATAPAGTFTTITAGRFHTCGLRPDGVFQCWGELAALGEPLGNTNG